MASEDEKDIPLEIGHVLFVDIVGYSKLLIDDQRELQQQLNRFVRDTQPFRTAEAAGKLIRSPTGDGMALVFFTAPEAPVECAVEIAQSLRNYPQMQLRMGINTGPISGLLDVNDRSTVAGAGINTAQRVMDCGDAGHILLSKRVAEDLAQYRKWQPHLEELGEIEVKHGQKIAIVNLRSQTFGNPDLPDKLKRASRQRKIRQLVRLGGFSALLLMIFALLLFLLRRPSSRDSDALAAISTKSIAVLPFSNFSADKDNAFFADGVQDEILTNLARIADLKVISRTSVMQFKEAAGRNLKQIGRELGVAHILEGSVQRDSGHVPVIAQLIDARTDAHLWAQTYDRELADIFAIQSDIAKTIARELRAKISPEEKTALDELPTADLGAYDLYLRGRSLYADTTEIAHAKEKLPECIRLAEQAVLRDPKFLAAWCLLSNAHGTVYYLGFDRTPERLDKVKKAAEAALNIDPRSGSAHLANALYYYRGFRDFSRARAELALARQTLPNDSEVLFYSGVFDYRQGEWGSATQTLEKAVELDPRNLLFLQQMALCYQPQRRYADELRMWQRALAVKPGDAVSRMCIAGVAANARGDMKPYEVTLAELLAEDPETARQLEDPFYVLRERTPEAAERLLRDYTPQSAYGVDFPRSYWAGVIARWQNDQAKAMAEFGAARAEVEKAMQAQPDSAAALSLLGLIDAGLGRKEQAVREALSACKLLPPSKDAVDGVAFVVNLAQIYAWTGQKDEALQQLETALNAPNDCHYGELRLHPIWDPLRGDPRFEKIVEATKDPIVVK